MFRLKRGVKPASPGQHCVGPHVACEPVGTVKGFAQTSVKGFTCTLGEEHIAQLTPQVVAIQPCI